MDTDSIIALIGGLVGIITAYWWIRWLIATILLPFRVKEIRDLLKELKKDIADRRNKNIT